MKNRFTATILALLLLLLASCEQPTAGPSAPSQSSEASSAHTSGEPSGEAPAPSGDDSAPAFDTRVLFVLTEITKTVDFHDANQRAYLENSYDSVAGYADGWSERSKPKPTRLEWEFRDDLLPEGAASPASFEVLLDTDPDFANARVYPVERKNRVDQSVSVTNLLLGAGYYWKVRASCGGLSAESAVSYFETASAGPRNLDIDGVSNVRDIGGWQIDETHRVRQGLIYRGAAFEDKQYETHITEEGIERIMTDLGIKTEIELRWISVGEIQSRKESLLGADVNYFEYEFNYNDEGLLNGNTGSFLKCFKAFADESNYPIYYHCRIGTDRTGVLTYLLLGLLGVDKETILRDYLFSNFGYVGGQRKVSTIQSAYIDKLEAFEGDTLQEKVTNFLKSKCGLTDETLEKVKALLTEEI